MNLIYNLIWSSDQMPGSEPRCLSWLNESHFRDPEIKTHTRDLIYIHLAVTNKLPANRGTSYINIGKFVHHSRFVSWKYTYSLSGRIWGLNVLRFCDETLAQSPQRIILHTSVFTTFQSCLGTLELNGCWVWHKQYF